MGLTNSSTGKKLIRRKNSKTDAPGFKVAIAGNPNVGKSTVFNSLTGMNQHTGNWPGKTVGYAEGTFRVKDNLFLAIDVPGTYSLLTHSPEEEIAKEIILSDGVDGVAVVCDATCLERNLILALQILDLGKPTVICVNLLDEAERKGISIDLKRLSEELGVPVVGAVARRRGGLNALKSILSDMWSNPSEFARMGADKNYQSDTERYVLEAERIAAAALKRSNEKKESRDRTLDKLFIGKKTAFPVMFALLLLVFWLTVVGANYPSELISKALFYFGDLMSGALLYIGCPDFIRGLLLDGLYKTLAWIVSVMLPPMAIFFPLFTLLEDSGYLPRVAFNLDSPFKRCKSCGKQALTMCMGFGCNAAGVVGCRIIDSPRERLIAMITNSFVPCNGRFPLLIALITMFFIGSNGGLGAGLASAVFLSVLISLSIIITLLTSKILSATLLKGAPSAFTLELPPYRRPEIGKVIVRSVLDRTVFVLGRAIVSAIPAGIILWLMANLHIGDSTLLSLCSGFLDPFARLLGLDGVILIAFILGFPANEIVIPVMIMAYMSRSSLTDYKSLFELKELFISNGWTETTAICTMLFSLFHWPCATTVLTVKKESGSLKWTAAAIIIPTVIGMLLCAAVNALARFL